MIVRQVEACRACGSGALSLVVSLGWLPLANRYLPIGSTEALPFFPHEIFRCDACGVAQLGIVAESWDVFDAGYPYRSGVTKQLRDNFAGLHRDVTEVAEPKATDLVVDIGGNDGTLLSNFSQQFRVNVTPEDMGKLGEEHGVRHVQGYWCKEAARRVVASYGKARVVTATNVFAHIKDPGEFLDAVLDVLADDGLFVVECQDFGALVDGVQYEHAYLEHQLFWSLDGCAKFLATRGLGVERHRRIPTHGGSFRLIAMRGKMGAIPLERPVDSSAFAKRVAASKTDLWSLLASNYNATVAGIGAPSRASTLINYVGIDHNVCPYICETEGSAKLGKYMPGTRIPIVPEDAAALDVDYLLLFAHHIAADLMPAIRAKGFKGKFIKPLPRPEVIG